MWGKISLYTMQGDLTFKCQWKCRVWRFCLYLPLAYWRIEGNSPILCKWGKGRGEWSTSAMPLSFRFYITGKGKERLGWALLSKYLDATVTGKFMQIITWQEQRKGCSVCKPCPWGRSLTLSGNLFPLNKANAAHETQAFIIYGKFIIRPVYGCGGTESLPLLLNRVVPCSSARAAVTDQPWMLHFHTIAVLRWATWRSSWTLWS